VPRANVENNIVLCAVLSRSLSLSGHLLLIGYQHE